MINTLLISNRGEIALRVLRTAREMGIATVTVYTQADIGAPHAFAGDTAVQVDSYLDIDAIVAAARTSGADAVHPGYGFLSERAAFASALEAAGIKLVGPSAAVMEQMGRKDAAREIAVAAGVPVVPQGDDVSFPVLVKAAAGGGGKGMRVVTRPEDLAEAKAAAAREAANAFGDDTLLIEKYVESGRHIEVQVMGDSHGNVVHFYERDCSTQRRHQKVLEEAPAPTISAEVREQVTSAAVALAEHVGYENAGTVEFLLDTATNEPYFLEMNTRLQVEHPVTEAITGVDLVELQLRVASGEPLPMTQAEITATGHAIEARVYAEDAFGGFLPQAGTATVVFWPDVLPDVRVDEALTSGQVISTGFDPMLGKVIAYGETREDARQLLVQALDDTAIFGLTTNTGFLRALVASDEFRDCLIDTAWLDHNDVPAPLDAGARVLAGITLGFDLAEAPDGPWEPDSFRLGGPRGPLVQYGRDLTAGDWYTATALEDGVWWVSAFECADGFVLSDGDGTEVITSGQRFVFDRPDPFDAHHGGGAGGSIEAPMPGTVLAVNVAVGDRVTEGQTLGVLEAMKMELALKAPYDGIVTHADATVGAQVPLGQLLFEVAADE